jgi:predicted nucleic acid-binding protein
VGLWRRQGWAVHFARENPDKVLGLSWVVLGEFWHGAIRAGHDRRTVQAFLDMGIPLLDPAPVIHHYANLCAALQDDPDYRRTGQNDLWIGAVALAFDKPLVTRNRRHFDSFPDLELLALGDS